MSILRALLAGTFCSCFVVSGLAAAELEAHSAAKRVDELLSKELFGGSEGQAARPVPQADDPTFLRRASLDLVGAPPSPEEITAFALDTSAGKRAAAIERLLADKRFGDNWGRYWRDVIMYRRTEPRALLAAPALAEFLSESFNGLPHWDQIARAFITASGDVTENGATGLIMAQMAGTEDTTAEISRIFMGIQIQCAQCHNHPTDRWKREQFHELAAFFPRLAMRPVRVEGKRRSFAIVGDDRARGKKANNPRAATVEHYMPDLEHPEEEGKLMTPVFFVTGQKLETGASDGERREKIAQWITDRDNRWFSKAFVNRMWSELVGRGFYEPVDDIGPDRQCSAPQTLDYLSERFAGTGYDVKWLMRTIMATEAYGRESRSRADEARAPFVAACPQRLRGDQLFNALATVLEMPEPAGREQATYRNPNAGPRGQVNQTFGYDPSVLRDEVVGSIPQALFLMNSPELARAMGGRQRATSLGRLLAEVTDDDDLVGELYLRCLAREPKQAELATCLDHVRATEDRTEAFEDILWALVNSTEFLNRK
jgi:hypothetical protein